MSGAEPAEPTTFFEVRMAWGLPGMQRLTRDCDAVVVIDVLSFTTAVEVALSRGAVVLPYRWQDEMAEEYAASKNAELAGRRGVSRWSLSPKALEALPAGTRLVLPSPNGATVSIAGGDTPTFAACLRNARAVAEAAGAVGSRIGVIPAGELVHTDWTEGGRRAVTGVFRPALEDLYGAGAVLRHLQGRRSPEAQAAVDAFEAAHETLRARIVACDSGRELIDRGFAEDVDVAAALDVSDVVPRLREGAWVVD